MIEVYGWAIQENGEPAKGAKFTITIPKINQKEKRTFKLRKGCFKYSANSSVQLL